MANLILSYMLSYACSSRTRCDCTCLGPSVFETPCSFDICEYEDPNGQKCSE